MHKKKSSYDEEESILYLLYLSKSFDFGLIEGDDM